jgi:hypothetical protein
MQMTTHPALRLTATAATGTLFMAMAASVALPQGIVYQQTIQGGLAVDASGVSTPFDGSTTWYAGDPLEVLIPSSAAVTKAYAFVRSGPDGFNPAVPYPAAIAVNGVPLSSATYLPGASTSRVGVFDLDPATFGLAGSGSYSYAEQGRADEGFFSGYKVGGTTLAVIYGDASRSGMRHIVLGVRHLFNGTTTFSGLPTSDTAGQMLLSLGIDWGCSDGQSGSVSVNGQLVTSAAGGRDDGVPFATMCGFQDWNSLITQGSFGFDDTDAWTGVDGDSPSTEPGGAANDSRLSDELWARPYDESGAAAVLYVGDGVSCTSVVAIAVEMDPAPTGVGDAPARAPRALNAPNPFRDFTRMEFELPAAGNVSLEVYDAAGRRVSTRSLTGLAAGRREYYFDGRDDAGKPLSSGVYFYRFTGAGPATTHKLTIVR